MEMLLKEQVEIAIKLLTENGYEAYAVGGCVRDILMGREPKDMDLTTDAQPEEMMRIFASYKLIETGLKHGTVTVMIDSIPLEITTFRIDGDYLDHRRPHHVRFTKSLKEDLARRDFTMNAIAYNPECGVVDPYGGREDIRAKTIRCVGNANHRFEEDALRILRGLRFSSQLGFEIEEETSKAILRKGNLLKFISAERIAGEFMKLLSGKHIKAVLTEYISVIGMVIPELLPMNGFQQNSPYHIYDVLTHSALVVEKVAQIPQLKLAALLHDIGKPQTFSKDEKSIGHFYGHAEISVQIAKGILTRLKLDHFTKERVLTLIQYHDIQIEPEERVVRRWLNRLSPPVFFELMELKRADNLAQSPQFFHHQEKLERITQIAYHIMEEGLCFSLKELQVKGEDLKAIGMKEGKEIGKALNKLLELVLDEELENTKEVLMEFIRKQSS